MRKSPLDWQFSRENQRTGQVALVTGANTGLGYETVRSLAKLDMTVVMACRSSARGLNAVNRLLSEQPRARLVLIELDLGDMHSVRAFAEQFLAQFQRLDLLINNAGLMMPPYHKTLQSMESQFGINYLGHFLLTALLYPVIRRTGGARIVSLASLAHKWDRIHFSDLNWEQGYRPKPAYGQSKLACLLFSFELNRRIMVAGDRVSSVAAHPGVSVTELGRFLPGFVNSIGRRLFPAPESAVQSILCAALYQDIIGGDYIGPVGFQEMAGPPGYASYSHYSAQSEPAIELWKISEGLCNIQFLSSE